MYNTLKVLLIGLFYFKVDKYQAQSLSAFIIVVIVINFLVKDINEK